jgi:hypothetical protein
VLLLGDEVRYRLARAEPSALRTGPLGLGGLSHEPACAQIGEVVHVVPGESVPATVKHAKPRCLLSFQLALQCPFCSFQLGKGELDT